MLSESLFRFGVGPIRSFRIQGVMAGPSGGHASVMRLHFPRDCRSGRTQRRFPDGLTHSIGRRP
jgi:hypothetical protein